MHADRSDRRTRYTQMVLKKSLIEWMEQKPLAKITIKELCERADINRCTFYAHYRDQYDLLQQIEDEIISEIRERLSAFDFRADIGVAFQVVEQIFQYIADNRDFCSLLLSEKGDFSFQKRVTALFQEQYAQQWQASRSTDPETVEYLYRYVITGSIGILQNWLKSGMRKSPGEMAGLLLRLTNQGLAAFS